MTKGGIQVRSKAEMKVELGRSPDKGDAVIMANIAILPTRSEPIAWRPTARLLSAMLNEMRRTLKGNAPSMSV
jgi:hypothetical protein